jgi:uncharacterized protein YxjI
MDKATAATLVFPDRRHRGTFPVRDGGGRLVARIATRWTGTAFTAADADGHPLCAASTGWFGLRGRWRATGPDGRPLLQVDRSLLRPRATLTLAAGARFAIHGSVWRRDFSITDAAGLPVLTAVPTTPALSLRPHDYAVAVVRPVLGLAEVVALVQIWRMAAKGDDSAGGATATMAASAG